MIECGFYHGDCMDYLKELPDKSIDLAIVDPPYGDALQNEGGGTITDSAKGSTVTRGGVARQTEIPPRCIDRERIAESPTGHGVTRTGGGWSQRYDPTKKS